MSLTARRPKHAFTPPPAQDTDYLLAAAHAEVREVRRQLGLAITDVRTWRWRALQAEHVLSVLPAALANPDALIKRLFAEAETARVQNAELKAQLAQLQPTTTEPKDGTQ